MNGTQTVDPRVIADALQMDTHDLAKLLCTFATDALPIEAWMERSYKPLPLEFFDERAAAARRHLEAAHAAWEAWTADNPAFGEGDETA